MGRISPELDAGCEPSSVLAPPEHRIVRLAVAVALVASAIGCGGNGSGGGGAGGEPSIQVGCDPSFGDRGIVLTKHGVEAAAFGVGLQPDGKIVVAGTHRTTNAQSTEILVARYLADGTLDSGFGAQGLVATDVGAFSDEANAVALQDDGNIVVAGTHYLDQAQHTWVLARYVPSGALDPTFGNGGVVISDACKPYGELQALALQPDGKIVAAGSCDYDVTLARYDVDGSLDSTFGVDGLVVDASGPSYYFAAVLIQPDGRIVAAGTLLARYEANGAGDVSFETHTLAVAARGVALVGDGKVVTVTSALGVGSDFAFSRFTAVGAVDSSFGGGGTTLLDVESSAETPWGLTARADGSSIAVGAASSVPGSANISDWAVARLTPDGAPDTAFGGDGTVITRPGNGNSAARAAAVQADDKVVVAGHTDVGDSRQITVVRYAP